MRSGAGCFFFEQKTACEMRISDWSSDVCSSELVDQGVGAFERGHRIAGCIDANQWPRKAVRAGQSYDRLRPQRCARAVGSNLAAIRREPGHRYRLSLDSEPRLFEFGGEPIAATIVTGAAGLLVAEADITVKIAFDRCRDSGSGRCGHGKERKGGGTHQELPPVRMWECHNQIGRATV